MKQTKEQVEARLSLAWGRPSTVVAYHLYGNRLTYAARDDGNHWMPLETSWDGGRQLFEPVGMDWPSTDGKAWVDAVNRAAALARDHFIEQRNPDALKRLPRAQVIAEARNWQCQGDEHDTWLIPGSSGGSAYSVNDRCTCPDYLENGVAWCKHRLARALARRAEKFLQEGQGAGGDASAPAKPEGSHGDPHGAAAPGNGQAQRIDLIVAYQADEAKILPRINGNGKLIVFKADGQVADPPSPTMPDIYRWLQAQGYIPGEFKWLHWEHGLRHRLQSYIREVGR